MMYEICPSILSADFNRLGEQLAVLREENINILHIDVMDGMFVPSISFGMPLISSIRKECPLVFDVHLMVTDPVRYIGDFARCGADRITVHLEACPDVRAALEAIHSQGLKAGLSIKPGTPAGEVAPYLGDVDLVLVMTVEPGFGGQSYIAACTDKIKAVRRMIEECGRDIELQVDGGINLSTMETVMAAGANWLVCGSSAFGPDIRERVRTLKAGMADIEKRLLPGQAER